MEVVSRKEADRLITAEVMSEVVRLKRIRKTK
jgi:hypothetical protein